MPTPQNFINSGTLNCNLEGGGFVGRRRRVTPWETSVVTTKVALPPLPLLAMVAVPSPSWKGLGSRTLSATSITVIFYLNLPAFPNFSIKFFVDDEASSPLPVKKPRHLTVPKNPSIPMNSITQTQIQIIQSFNFF